jgi:hypothetical protein
MPIGLYMDLGSSAACRGQQYGVLDPAGDDARMVLIKHQAPDGADQFLFHASSTTPVDQLVESLAEVRPHRPPAPFPLFTVRPHGAGSAHSTPPQAPASSPQLTRPLGHQTPGACCPWGVLPA